MDDDPNETGGEIPEDSGRQDYDVLGPSSVYIDGGQKPMLELVYSSTRATQPPVRTAQVSDQELLVAIRNGDEKALDELMTRKTRPLLQLVQRILGDVEEVRDVVQVTFFKVWENRRKYDERWSPNTWLYRIASNLAIDQLRSRRCRERGSEPVRLHLLHTADGEAHHDFATLQQSEVARIFRQLADGLPEKQRVIFVLREIEGLTCLEVAEILNTRQATVRNQLFTARKTLRAELLRRYPEYAARFAAIDRKEKES